VRRLYSLLKNSSFDFVLKGRGFKPRRKATQSIRLLAAVPRRVSSGGLKPFRIVTFVGSLKQCPDTELCQTAPLPIPPYPVCAGFL
jgi:hypothetical protein